MGYESAIFLLNQKLEQDVVLQRIFAPKQVFVYPGFADEPTANMQSFPYIRYQFIPIPSRNLPWLRRDWCQYFVGDDDFSRVVNAVERILWLLNLENIDSLDLPVKDNTGKFKIHEIRVNTGTIPNQPSQDLGVWEQGLAFSLRYVVRTPSWDVTSTSTHGVEVLLA